MAVVVTPITEGFELDDGQDGPFGRQRFSVTGLQGSPTTWIAQAQAVTQGDSLPKRGTPYPDQDYANRGAICRHVGIETVVDAGQAFMYAIYTRGYWGSGGRQKLTRTSQVFEDEIMPVFENTANTTSGPIYRRVDIPIKRIRMELVAVVWLGPSPQEVSDLRHAMANALGYFFNIGYTYGQQADRYVFVGGDSQTDGNLATRAEYRFVRWQPIDKPDLTGYYYPRPIPALSAWEKWTVVSDGTTPSVIAAQREIIRTDINVPVLPGLG